MAELVPQEFWGPLLAHLAVRGLMHEAALRARSALARTVQTKWSCSAQRRPVSTGAGTSPATSSRWPKM